MKPKIIFYDIDGTLISDGADVIPESTVKAITKARQAGHISIINTGRTKEILEPFITESVFDGFICGCGTYIEYKGKVLFHINLGNAMSREIVGDLRKYRLSGILEAATAVYYDTQDNAPYKRTILLQERHKKAGFHCLAWDDPYINFDKFTMYKTEHSDFDSFYNKYKDKLDFIKRGEILYEIAPKGYSKATGIEALIKLLDIPHENTYAIGDSSNDLPMFNYVKYSIAMGNSAPELFEHVTYKTTNVENDGIENALKYYQIIN